MADEIQPGEDWGQIREKINVVLGADGFLAQSQAARDEAIAARDVSVAASVATDAARVAAEAAEEQAEAARDQTVAALIFEFRDASTLRADTTLTYTAGQSGTVAVGDIIRTRAEGFAYQVAASGATDQHVITAGGVKLYRLPSAAIHYVSPTGNDSNAGNAPDAPFQTLARAAAVAVSGDTVRLERGGVWRETATFAEGVIVEPYGAGERPIISGQDVVTTFALEGSGPAYRFSIDLPAGVLNRTYPGVFEDGRRMREYRIGRDGITTTAGVIAAVQANPGSFGFVSWSVNPETGLTGFPGNWTAGTKDYVIHATGGGNPNTNGRIYEAYKRAYSAAGRALYRGIRLIGGYHHDGITAPMDGGSIERIARHGNLPAVPQFSGVAVIGPNPAYSGGGDFHSNPRSLQRDVVYDGCAAIGDETLTPRVGIGYYSHGAFNDVPIRARATLLNSSAFAKAIAIHFTEVTTVDVLDFTARRCDQHVTMNAGQTVNLINCDMRGGRGGTGDGGRQTLNHRADNQLNIRGGYYDWRGQRFFETGGGVRNILIEDAMLVARPTILPGNDGAFARSTSALTDLKVRRSIIVNAGDPAALEWLAIAPNSSGCEFRDTLIVGQATRGGVVRRGECLINGLTVAVSTLDASARVFGIDRTRVLQSDGPDGIRLREGHYRPGDWVFNGCAVSPTDAQPRAYVIVGDRVISSDTATFQLLPVNTFVPPQIMRGAAHMATGSRFIAVGDVGTFIRSATDSATGWAAVTTGVTDNLHACAANGAVIVAVGAAGCIIRSTDSGATWTEITNSGPRYTAQNLFAVACNGSTWIAAGSAGTVLRSTDNGVTWTTTTAGSSEFRACHRSTIASLFILGGVGGTIYTSTDGASWTLRTTGTFNTIRGIAEADGEIVAVLYQSTRHTDTFIRSTNGTDWTVLPETMPFEVVGIAGGGAVGISQQQNFFCVGESQALGWRRRGGWNVQRIGAVDPQMGSDTMADWLRRAR